MRKQPVVEPATIPAFASEEEERRFWDDHDPSEYFTDPADVIVRLRSKKKRMISVRLDEALYEELRAVAGRNEVPYQQLMRELLRDALTKLAKREGRAA